MSEYNKTPERIASGSVEQVRGIEPPCSAWEADILPLNYTRKFFYIILEHNINCKRNLTDATSCGHKKFTKKCWTNPSIFAILHNSKKKGGVIMKIIHAVPTDVDELIFSGESPLPSDR